MAQSLPRFARTKPFGPSEYFDFVRAELPVPIYGGILNIKAPIYLEKLGVGEPTISLPQISSTVDNGGVAGSNAKSASVTIDLSPLVEPLPDKSLDTYLAIELPDKNAGFQWGPALKQSFFFVMIAHSWRLSTEPSTRADLKGPFFKEYFQSARNLRGWRDGDEAFVNYLGHPMEGAVAGFIQVHNDPKGIRQLVGVSNDEYWKSRLKAFGWSMAWSLQFELGPLGEASVGNVGLYPSKKSNHPMAYVDIVITPVLGTGWLIGEDIVDRYLIRYIESRTKNRTLRILARSFLNPTRAWANFLRGKWFWYRDDRPTLIDEPWR